MPRYRPPARLPVGSHLRYFHLLTPEEQARSVRRLSRNQPAERVAQLTGFNAAQIKEILDDPAWRDDE
jgi:hypothetical protein